MVITDTAVAAERLVAGDLDLIVTSDTEATLTLRDAAGERGVGTPIENQRTEESLLVINSRRAPFDDIEVRKALTFATDRDRYIAFIRQGTAPPADTMFHPDLDWHNREVKQETNMGERAGPIVESYCADHPGSCSEGKINMKYLYSSASGENKLVANLMSDAWGDFFNVDAVAG